MPLEILRANRGNLSTAAESFADRVNVGDARARAGKAAAHVGFCEQTVPGPDYRAPLERPSDPDQDVARAEWTSQPPATKWHI